MDRPLENLIESVITIEHEHGQHARPADLFVRCANNYRAAITIYNLTRIPEKKANAKSILGVLALAVRSSDSIRITASGEDAQEAIQGVIAFLRHANHYKRANPDLKAYTLYELQAHIASRQETLSDPDLQGIEIALKFLANLDSNAAPRRMAAPAVSRAGAR